MARSPAARSARPRLTPGGWGVAALVVLLGAAGVTLGYTVLVVVALGGATALIVGLLTTLGVPKLAVEREIEPARVERGRSALGLVTVRNAGRMRTRACTAIEQLPDGELHLAIPALRAGATTSVPYELPTERRGALQIGPFALTLGDPFGLWHARRVVGDTRMLFVKPRIHAVTPRPAGRTQHVEGPTSDTAPRGTITFHALREYVLGDDIRRIHWKTTARTGTLMVREHVDTSQPSTVIVLDNRADRYDVEGFEEAVDVAASVAAASEQRGFPIRFVTTTGETLLVRAGHRGNELDDVLSAIQLDDEGTMRHAAVAATGGSDHDVIIVIGGDVDTTDLAAVTQMTGRFGQKALVTIRRTDPAAGTPSRWAAGTHLDGPTARAAMTSWATGSRRSSR